ncbi:MAG: glycerophosphodiester phosphodiesterase [Oscillospiraceae bacterium]|nr:glycerophosphodiester phosphodiesterase [Oscillospiraceae bacterium]
MTKFRKPIKILAVILIVLFGMYLFLIAPRMRNKPDMSAFDGAFIAHRGYFDNEKGIPENSLPSFEAAIEKGFAIELDIQLSSDGVAMVFHDADLDRVCGVKGKIWDYTAADLKEMKLFGTEQTIPTFEETLALIDGRVPLLVEYKMDRVDTAVCAAGQALLDEYEGEYMMQCFDPRALLWYKKNAPQVARGQLAEKFWEKDEYSGKPLYLVLTYMLENVATRPDFISYKAVHKDNISLNLCRLMGAETACYTLKSAEELEYVKGEFDMYIFDSFDISQYR